MPAFPAPLLSDALPTTLLGVADSDVSDPLTKNNLQTAEAVLSLGLIVVKQLTLKGVATVFINTDGVVELCPAGEIELDSLTEGQALDTLLDRGYSDEQLVAYLRGRTARGEVHE
jgi:hypothetical protein